MNELDHIEQKHLELTEMSKFLELNPGPVCRLDKNGKVIVANTAAEKLFGDKNIIGALWQQLCPGFTGDKWQQVTNFATPFLLETKVGKTSILFSHVCADTNDAVFVFGTDISSQKVIEEQLAATTAVISEMARFPDMNPGPVLRMDFHGFILLSNKGATSVFGQELKNKCWKEICPGMTDDKWQTILSSESIIPFEVQVGSKYFVFNHRKDHETNLVFTYGTDITANKQIEKELHQEKAKVAEIARFPDMNPGPVLRMTLNAEIRLCNAAAQKVFGDDVTGRCWLDVCPGMNQDVWQQITTAERVFPFETRIADQYFVFNHRTDFVTNLVFTFGANITQQKLTEKQLIQSEKMASLGELTAGIAHEIQNPLNFVNNFSEVSTELLDEMREELAIGNMQQANEIADDVKQNLAKILHHGKQADGIVKGMLQHSRSSTATKEPTDINKLADEYLRLAFHGLRAKDKSFNAVLKTDYDESIGNINIIPQDIGRVILNLITNAFYAVTEKKKQQPEGYEPTISIRTKKIDNKVSISVKDNGNGIPPKVLDKIFQPFFTTKPTGQGTGLGLSLSYDIIKAHGGEMKVETKEGEGAEFIIELPVK